MDMVCGLADGWPCNSCGKPVAGAFSIDYEKGQIWHSGCPEPRHSKRRRFSSLGGVFR
jgi:hypothetical protein